MLLTDKPYYSEQINAINMYVDSRRVCYNLGKFHICSKDPHISTFILNNPA